jgi:ubiquitin-protein ligase
MGFITEPKDTPCQNGIFYLGIKLPNEYPFHGPRIKFLTKIKLLKDLNIEPGTGKGSF